MRKITTVLFTILFTTTAFANHVPTHKIVVPVKKTVPDTKKWLPPLEIQNKKN